MYAQVYQHFDFLSQAVKLTPQDFQKLINTASGPQIEALIACLSIRRHHELHEKEKALISKAKRSKRVRKFMASKAKYFIPIIASALSKALSEFFLCMSDCV